MGRRQVIFVNSHLLLTTLADSAIIIMMIMIMIIIIIVFYRHWYFPLGHEIYRSHDYEFTIIIT